MITGLIKKPIEVNPAMTNIVSSVGYMNAAQLRLFLGVTALSTKPPIDYFVNKDLDSDTRKYSVGKVIAKTIIGTATGVAARHYGFKAGMKLVEKQVVKVPFTDKVRAKNFVDGVANTLAFVTTIFSALFVDVPLMNKSMDMVAKTLSPKDKKSKGLIA